MAAYIEELKKVNEELRQARRAALNLMEDAILSKEALRQSEEKYRTKLEQDVRDRTAELNATKERLEATLDSSLYVIQAFKAVRNEQGKIVDFTWVMNNRQAIQQNGNVIGKSMLKQNPGVVPSGLFEKFAHVIETGIPLDHEQYYDYEQFNGWFHQTVVKLGDGFVMSTEDITEKRNAREEILRLKDEIAQRVTDRYYSLFNSIDEGFCIIEMIYDEAGKATDYRFVEVNQSFEKQTGLKNVVGKSGLELTPGNEPYWMEAYNKVAQTGEAIRFENYHQSTKRWYESYASRVGGAGSRQVAIVFNDTKRKKAEEALRESDERKAFLLKLSDALRLLAEPVAVQETVSGVAMEHFRSDRCYYCKIEGDDAVIRRDAAKQGLPSVAGIYSMSSNPVFKAVVDAGKPFVVPNVHSTEIIDEALRQLCIQLQVISFIDIPVVKGGKPVGIFCVVQSTPREWTESETELAGEVAERTWAALERAKAEEALRESKLLLARELEDTKQLQKISSRIIEEGNVQALYQAIVDSAKEIMHADFASIQILLPGSNKLLLFAWKGSHPATAEYWKLISTDVNTSCGQALQHKARIVIPNIEEWPAISKKDLDEYRRLGVLAMQSTPLISRTGKIIGMISTHWNQVHHPSERELGLLEVLARQAADLVERKKAEDAMRHSEERLRTLADAVPQVIWANDEKGKAVYFNKRWYEYTGLNYEQSAGPGWQVIVHPNDAPAAVEKWKEALAKEETFDTEYRLRRHDGEYCWFIGRNVPLKDSTGKITGWFGSATDIDYAKKTQEALSQSEARLRITMESATDYAIITMDTERRIERWSSGASQIFGYTEAEVLGQPADIIFTKEDRKAGVPQKEMETARDSGRADDERWHRRKDGSRFYVSGVMRPIQNQELSGYVKVAQDMTQQQLFTEELHRLVAERTAELQRSNEDLRQFAHVASHDLKEPVRKIKTFNNRITEDFSEVLPEKVNLYLSKISNATDRMYSMIDGILSYSKHSNAKQSPEVVDLNETIEAIETDLEVLIQQKNAVIEAAQLPVITADKLLIYQLFYNLILNSLKFSKKGEPALINIFSEIVNEDETSFVKILLSDNGIGFESEFEQAIFETFTRLNPADEYEGTGLGLALCKKIVERHGGSISASGQPGAGATFTILLPLLPATSQS